ncbi:MAG: hypothetical protein AABY22_06290, partial [Nanoarchaeota archaeon]
MAIRIPKKGERTEWMKPFDVDGNTDKYDSPEVQPENQAVPSSNLGIARINPREYIQLGINGIHRTPAVISAYELQESNNKNYENAHRFVLEKGLYMPTPFLFMAYFKKVMSAQKGAGKLHYADGFQVPDAEVNEIFRHLTSNHKDIFASSNPGVWTWLNAQFNKGNLETVTGIDSTGNLIKTSSKLESCLNKDCYVNIDFNFQGLATPTSISQNQKYSQGENIY